MEDNMVRVVAVAVTPALTRSVVRGARTGSGEIDGGQQGESIIFR